jgi:hypothetical protein
MAYRVSLLAGLSAESGTQHMLGYMYSTALLNERCVQAVADAIRANAGERAVASALLRSGLLLAESA